MIRTHTRTWPLLNAWASSFPWTDGDHSAMVGAPCAVPRCGEPLAAGEEVYAVLETGGPDAPESIPCRYGPLMTLNCGHAEQWVCWRHVRPDAGPVTAAPE